MKIFWSCALLIAATIFLTACSKGEPPVEVSVQKVQTGDGLTLNHAGTISLSDAVEIRSSVSGKVMEKFFSEGADVKEEQVLFTVSELEPHTDLLKKKTELAKARTDLAKALTEKDPSAAELQLEVDELSELVKKLDDDAANSMIHAPKAGRLESANSPLGMSVTANETLLGTVGNINPVSVRFEISAAEARLLSTGNLTARLKLSDGSTYPRDGTIKISDDAKTAEIFFDNPDETLTPGTPAQIEIDGAKLVGVLLVPESAIQRREDGDFVFAVDSDKTAAVKKISLGDKLGTYFIVTNGLKANDSIVVEGQTNLREGTPLKFRD